MSNLCISRYQTATDGVVACAATEAHSAHCSVWPPRGLGYIWWDEQAASMTPAQDEE